MSENNNGIKELEKYLLGMDIKEIDFSIVKEDDIPGNIDFFDFWIEWCKNHDRLKGKK